MAEKKDRDFLDIISTLLLPIVIFIVGIYVANQTHKDDVARTNSVNEENKSRQKFDRDAGYVKMLVSGTTREQKMALVFIQDLSGPNQLSPELYRVLEHFCADDSDSELRNEACAALKKDSEAQAAPTRLAEQGTTVYLQMASPNQQQGAELLRVALGKENFTVPTAELVSSPVATVHTYVRFFSAPSAKQASQVKDVMDKLGYSSVGIQDFSAYAEKPSSNIEVWIGKSQGPLK